MTAVNGAPTPRADLGDLGTLPGLATAVEQMVDLIAVLRAEQARRQAGIAISRAAWKNLVFTGGPGTGKSRVARALARLYKDLGLLTFGHLIEIAAADLAGATPRDTATQVAEVIKSRGDLLLITGAHTWHDLPDRGQHLLGCLYQQMTAAQRDYEGSPGELVIILSGRKDPLHALLATNPALAARFPAIIDFPGYTPAQLADIVTELASEAGLCLTPDAQCKVATVLAEAEERHATGNARLAVRLLNQATTSQGRRVIAASHRLDSAALATICADDIPGQLHFEDSPSDHQRPGQYL